MSAGNLYKIFVYGTLKRGQPNHYLIEGKEYGIARYLGKGLTVQKYPLVIATQYNIPFVLDAEGKGKNIFGEVYEIDDRMLKRLDELEDYPKFYQRALVKTNILQEHDHERKTYSNSDDCLVYVLRNFKPDLLHLSFLDTYPDSSNYVFAKDRDPHFDKYKAVQIN